MGRFIIPYILGGEKLVVFIEFKKRSFGLRPQDDKDLPNGVILQPVKNLLFFFQKSIKKGISFRLKSSGWQQKFEW